jgi:hypothetical protein
MPAELAHQWARKLQARRLRPQGLSLPAAGRNQDGRWRHCRSSFRVRLLHQPPPGGYVSTS